MISFRSCLWFDGQALAAAEFYKKIFKNVEITQIEKYGKAGHEIHQQTEGSIMTVAFNIGKQKFLGLNAGPLFKFNPSFSNFIFCSSKNEIDRLWNDLSTDGKIRMSLEEYPWSKKYGWTTDRFGVEWQIMLSENQDEILPALLFVDQLYGQGQNALNFYTKHFKSSEILFKAMDESNKIVMHAQFSLNEQKFVLMEGPGQHGHTFNEAYSIIIECESQKEIDEHWNGLSKGGLASACGWLKDPYGVSWQVNPAQMSHWLKNASDAQKDRLMTTLLKMKKIDIATLEKAIG